MSNYKWFDDNEVKNLDKELCAGLDMARQETVDEDPEGKGIPFFIDSGFRTPANNRGLSGAVGNSSHLTGHAVDLHVQDDFAFERMVKALQNAGFNRLGFYYSLDGTKLIPRHIHVDNDKTKTAHTIWSAIEQN